MALGQRHSVVQEHNRVRDTRLAHELAFYLEGLDVVSAQSDPASLAAHMFKHAIASPAPEIAGAINADCAIERISLEDFRRQVRIVPISLRETSAANDDFAYSARRNKRTRLILYADFHPIDRTANRDDASLGKTRRGEDLGRNNSGTLSTNRYVRCANLLRDAG